MIVRPLAPGDVPALCARVVTLPLLVRYRHTAASLAVDLQAGVARGESVLVAEDDDGHPCGLAWFLPRGTFGLGGYLRLIAVAPDAHRRGVGGALLQAFEAAVGMQARHAFLLVSDFNRDAQRFYARHGYVEAGALPQLVLADVDERIYWKRL